MLTRFNKLIGTKPSPNSVASVPEPLADMDQQRSSGPKNTIIYSKVFRWRLPEGQLEEPRSVEVVGSFNDWQPTELKLDAVMNAWHVTMHQIPGGRTHHYMFLVNNEPAYDKHCDGLSLPTGAQEERFALSTTRGPRVFMLFGHAK
jgi:hypothetical protein